MCDGTMKVIKHELKDRLDLIFSVAGEVSKGGILRATISLSFNEDGTLNIPMDHFRESTERHTLPWQQSDSVDTS